MKIQNVTAAMRPMTKPPSPQELIAKADEDADGALSKTEWQSITDKIPPVRSLSDAWNGNSRPEGQAVNHHATWNRDGDDEAGVRIGQTQTT